MKKIYLFLFIAFTLIECLPANYQFKKGQILLPDYVCKDTLIVSQNFNLPGNLITDQQISNFIKTKTIKK